MSPVTVPVDNAFTLAACAETIYLDKPFLERVDVIAARGLKVEIWDWTSKDLKTLAARRGDGVEIVSMTGYVEGDLTTDEGVARILSTAEDSLRAAETIDCPRLNFHGTGLGEGAFQSSPTPTPARTTGCAPSTPASASPSSVSGTAGSSPWRTSTPPSTTPGAPSPGPVTPVPSSRQSTLPTCA